MDKQRNVSRLTFITIQVSYAVSIAVLVAPYVDSVDDLVLPPGSGIRGFAFWVNQHQRHHGYDQRQPAQKDDGDAYHAQTPPERFGGVLQ